MFSGKSERIHITKNRSLQYYTYSSHRHYKKNCLENSVLKNMNIDVRVLGYKERLLNLIQARDSFIRSAFFRLYFCKGVYVLLLFLLKAIPLVK